MQLQYPILALELENRLSVPGLKHHQDHLHHHLDLLCAKVLLTEKKNTNVKIAFVTLFNFIVLGLKNYFLDYYIIICCINSYN